MLVTLTVPEDSVGDVIGDLNSRRGRPQGMEPGPAGMTEVKAEVPMSEMLTYAPDLRSLTGGQGDYTMEFERYEEVPAHLAGKVVAESRRRRPRLSGSLGWPRDPKGHNDVARRRVVRRLRADTAARRARRRVPARRPAAHGVRAVHAARGPRGLDPRGPGRRPRARPRRAAARARCWAACGPGCAEVPQPADGAAAPRRSRAGAPSRRSRCPSRAPTAERRRPSASAAEPAGALRARRARRTPT